MSDDEYELEDAAAITQIQYRLRVRDTGPGGAALFADRAVVDIEELIARLVDANERIVELEKEVADAEEECGAAESKLEEVVGAGKHRRARVQVELEAAMKSVAAALELVHRKKLLEPVRSDEIVADALKNIERRS